MEKTFAFIRRTIATGLLTLVPILVLAYLLNKVWKWLKPTLQSTFANTLLSAALNWTVLSIFIGLLVCFLLGLLVKFTSVSDVGQWIEKKILIFIPGYQFYRAVLVEVLPTEGQKNRCAIIARTGNSWQPGILIEETEEFCVVFLFLGHSTLTGNIHVIASSEVKRLKTSILKLRKMTSQMGDGLLEVLPPRNTPPASGISQPVAETKTYTP